MDVQIRVAGGDEDDLASLHQWLVDEDAFRGRVRAVSAPIGETELGSLTDLLSVALASGGAGTVLAQSLTVWLKSRRTTATLTVEAADGRRVTFDLQTVAEAGPLLEQVLKAAGGE